MKYKLTKIGKMYIVSTYESTSYDKQVKVKRRGNKGYWNNRCRRENCERKDF